MIRSLMIVLLLLIPSLALADNPLISSDDYKTSPIQNFDDGKQVQKQVAPFQKQVQANIQANVQKLQSPVQKNVLKAERRGFLERRRERARDRRSVLLGAGGCASGSS